MSSTLPPGRSTRAASCRNLKGSGAWWRTSVAITASTLSFRSGCAGYIGLDEQHPSSGTQHARRFLQKPKGIRGMVEDISGDHGIDALIRQIQIGRAHV